MAQQKERELFLSDIYDYNVHIFQYWVFSVGSLYYILFLTGEFAYQTSYS